MPPNELRKIIKIIVKTFVLKNFILVSLNNFKDHINKIEESNNPGKIPNSLMTNPEKKDPTSPKKFFGIFSEITPQPGSSGWNENKIKKIDIEQKNKIEDKILLAILI